MNIAALNLDDIAARYQAAKEEIRRINNGGQWVANNPADFDRDPDWVIGKSLADVPKLISLFREKFGDVTTNATNMEVTDGVNA